MSKEIIQYSINELLSLFILSDPPEFLSDVSPIFVEESRPPIANYPKNVSIMAALNSNQKNAKNESNKFRQNSQSKVSNFSPKTISSTESLDKDQNNAEFTPIQSDPDLEATDFQPLKKNSPSSAKDTPKDFPSENSQPSNDNQDSNPPLIQQPFSPPNFDQPYFVPRSFSPFTSPDPPYFDSQTPPTYIPQNFSPFVPQPFTTQNPTPFVPQDAPQFVHQDAHQFVPQDASSIPSQDPTNMSDQSFPSAISPQFVPQVPPGFQQDAPQFVPNDSPSFSPQERFGNTDESLMSANGSFPQFPPGFYNQTFPSIYADGAEADQEKPFSSNEDQNDGFESIIDSKPDVSSSKSWETQQQPPQPPQFFDIQYNAARQDPPFQPEQQNQPPFQIQSGEVQHAQSRSGDTKKKQNGGQQSKPQNKKAENKAKSEKPAEKDDKTVKISPWGVKAKPSQQSFMDIMQSEETNKSMNPAPSAPVVISSSPKPSKPSKMSISTAPHKNGGNGGPNKNKKPARFPAPSEIPKPADFTADNIAIAIPRDTHQAPTVVYNFNSNANNGGSSFSITNQARGQKQGQSQGLSIANKPFGFNPSNIAVPTGMFNNNFYSS